MVDVCNLRRYAGPCRAYMIRWYYDKRLKRCTKFIYGGCRGNNNNFTTLRHCRSRCKQSRGIITKTRKFLPYNGYKVSKVNKARLYYTRRKRYRLIMKQRRTKLKRRLLPFFGHFGKTRIKLSIIFVI